MQKFEIICTLNDPLLNEESLNGLVTDGATIFRINGSHVLPEHVREYVTKVRKHVGNRIRILLDLPGNKIRTSALPQPIPLKAGKTFELRPDQLNHPPFLAHLKPGDILLANDSLLKFKVEGRNGDHVTLLSYTDGALSPNKGVHLTRPYPKMPLLFARDKALIRAAIESGIDCLGLSFVRTVSDIAEAKAEIGSAKIGLIVKVETREAVENLAGILREADEFLVDRGDLSCDIGIENVNRYQNHILRSVKNAGKKMYFATQFLLSMVENKTPLIGEICGLSDSIERGVDGIQLSEETAIGKHPREVLDVVRKVLSVARKTTSSEASKGPQVFWMTGRSGAGKTTVALQVKRALELQGMAVALVDGDDFRGFWGNDAGYSREDRFKNLRNIIFTAHQASRAFPVVIVSSLSPYREIRALARQKLGETAGFHEIFVNCPQAVCTERDPKGHYKRVARQQKQENFIGLTEDYEAPESPELVLSTDQQTPEQSARALLDYASSHLAIPSPGLPIHE